MARYILNTPILTSYGMYRFRKSTMEEAVAFLRTPGWTSAVGHEGTAALLTQLCGVEIPLNRIAVSMEPGDVALCFRLLRRQREGAELSLEDVRSVPHEYGFLERIE